VKRLWLAVATLTVLSAIPAPVQGQSQLCLVDISKVFKANTYFNEQMAALKSEADQFQTQLQAAQQTLTQRTEELRTMDAATPAYKTAENDLAQLTAKWEVDRRAKLRDLMQRESKLHYDTYLTINQLIGEYCAQNQVPIVIRFSSEPMKLEDPETIMQAFNNSVVYFSPRFDITDQIIQRMAQANPPSVTK
jgi:Skp family chaperone for outer membrane proteins